MIAAYLALVHELKVEFHYRLAGIKGEDAAAAVADRIEIACGVYFLDFHIRLRLSRVSYP